MEPLRTGISEQTSHHHSATQIELPKLICHCEEINNIGDMLEKSLMAGTFKILRCKKCGRTLATQQDGRIIL